MKNPPSSDPKLLRQMSALQDRLTEAEDTLNAIRSGAVDALVVHTSRGEQLFTLKGADQSYRALVEAMNEGALTLNNGIISYCNNHFAEMVRMPMENVFGASFSDLVQSDDILRLFRRLEKGLQAQGITEAVLKTGDGSLVPVLLSSARFSSEGQVAIGVVVTDITDRKEAERERQDLSRRIVNALEQERQRVARDLHDSVSQMLASAKYRLSHLVVSGPGGDRADLRQVCRLLENAISEVKLISHNLRPSELDDLGLVPALRSLTHEFQKRCGIVTRFRGDMMAGQLIGSGELKMTLYRIAQEALNNVEKHSKATRADVSLSRTRFHALLSVRDNGKGFEGHTGSGRKAGWGLENMRERARLLDGELEVASSLNKGTHICVRIPLTERSEKGRRAP
jgi:PAS domain S-box-containing protein